MCIRSAIRVLLLMRYSFAVNRRFKDCPMHGATLHRCCHACQTEPEGKCLMPADNLHGIMKTIITEDSMKGF